MSKKDSILEQAIEKYFKSDDHYMSTNPSLLTISTMLSMPQEAFLALYKTFRDASISILNHHLQKALIDAEAEGKDHKDFGYDCDFVDFQNYLRGRNEALNKIQEELEEGIKEFTNLPSELTDIIRGIDP